MKTKLLSAVAVTALVMSVSLASAQDNGGGMQGGNSDAMQNNSGGGSLSGGNAGSEGVCPPEQCPQGAAEAPQPGSAETGQGMQQGQAVQGEDQNATEGQARQTQDQDQNTGQARQNQDQDQNTGQASQDQGQGQMDKATAQRKKRNANGEETQTGQNQGKNEPQTTGSTNATADITEEQRTEIHKTIVESHVEPVAHVDFDIDVGVAVPSTVVLHPLPPRIVELVPAYAGYEFFMLADGRIIIVEPASHAIVYVLV